MPEPPSLADRLAFMALIIAVGVGIGLTLLNLGVPLPMSGSWAPVIFWAAVALVAGAWLWRSLRKP